MVSESTFLTSTFVMPARVRFSRALTTMSSVKSVPQTRPASPTSLLATNRSKPAPHPTSRTAAPRWTAPRENGLPTPHADSKNREWALSRMAGSYPKAFAPSLPVGYWNFPSAETDTSAYLSRIAFLISCRSEGDSGESFLTISSRQLPAPPDGGQAGATILFFSWSVMANPFPEYDCPCYLNISVQMTNPAHKTVVPERIWSNCSRSTGCSTDSRTLRRIYIPSRRSTSAERYWTN